MSDWRTEFLYKCAAAHPIPKKAFIWASEIEKARSSEELAQDGAKYDPKGKADTTEPDGDVEEV